MRSRRTSARRSVAQVTGAAATHVRRRSPAGDLTINAVSVGAIAADTNAGRTARRTIAAAVNSYSAQTSVYATILSSSPAQVVLTNSGSVPATPDIVIALSGTGDHGATGLTAAHDGRRHRHRLRRARHLVGRGADTAMTAMDAALSAVNTARATLGAVQNRFSSTVANLQTTSENLSASRSRIQDADFAAETAMLTRAQILQQAGTAMLAQANALPQNVLSLLK